MELRFADEGLTPVFGWRRFVLATPYQNGFDRVEAFTPVIQWCAAEFGSAGLRWNFGPGTITISEEDDAFTFKMRWC